MFHQEAVTPLTCRNKVLFCFSLAFTCKDDVVEAKFYCIIRERVSTRYNSIEFIQSLDETLSLFKKHTHDAWFLFRKRVNLVTRVSIIALFVNNTMFL